MHSLVDRSEADVVVDIWSRKRKIRRKQLVMRIVLSIISKTHLWANGVMLQTWVMIILNLLRRCHYLLLLRLYEVSTAASCCATQSRGRIYLYSSKTKLRKQGLERICWIKVVQIRLACSSQKVQGWFPRRQDHFLEGLWRLCDVKGLKVHQLTNLVQNFSLLSLSGILESLVKVESLELIL